MRVSADRNHPFYTSRCAEIRVFLAGSERSHVLFADEEGRFAVQCDLDANGRVQTHKHGPEKGQLKTINFVGDVRIECPEDLRAELDAVQAAIMQPRTAISEECSATGAGHYYVEGRKGEQCKYCGQPPGEAPAEHATPSYVNQLAGSSMGIAPVLPFYADPAPVPDLMNAVAAPAGPAIPQGVWFNHKDLNFYGAHSGQRMCEAYYQTWRKEATRFPKSAEECKAVGNPDGVWATSISAGSVGGALYAGSGLVGEGGYFAGVTNADILPITGVIDVSRAGCDKTAMGVANPFAQFAEALKEFTGTIKASLDEIKPKTKKPWTMVEQIRDEFVKLASGTSRPYADRLVQGFGIDPETLTGDPKQYPHLLDELRKQNKLYGRTTVHPPFETLPSILGGKPYVLDDRERAQYEELVQLSARLLRSGDEGKKLAQGVFRKHSHGGDGKLREVPAARFPVVRAELRKLLGMD